VSVRILLADDHAIVRRGLCGLLEAEPGFHVVAQAADGAEAVEAGLREKVDLAVLDVSMPRLTGLQAAARLLEQRPELRVVVLSMHDNEQFFFAALRAGASGYVLKSSAETDLVEACRAAMRGEPFVYPRAAEALIRHVLDRGEGAETLDPLTDRETEVVRMIAEGASGREIAAALGVSEKTVEHHRSNVLEKLGLRDRVALTRYAVRRGLIEP
jgi:DNA-binding NarL/FixJ family response regulator